MSIKEDEWGDLIITPERDEAFEQELVDALIAEENSRPRNSQAGLGPSAIGGCRERVRASLFENWSEPRSDVEWNAAAAIGTLMGHHIENVAARAMGGETEKAVTATLPCGISVTGNADLVLAQIERNRCVDVKTKPRTADASKYGVSDVYLYQLTIYTMGLVQMGILKEGATATLAYFGRSGEDRRPYVVNISWEEILILWEKIDRRIRQIVAIQEEMDQLAKADHVGRNALRNRLRDCSPAYAIATGCPCLEGAEYDAKEPITEPHVIQLANDYMAAKKAAEDSAAEQRRLKEQLRGIKGTTADGTKVIWATNGALTVRKPKGT